MGRSMKRGPSWRGRSITSGLTITTRSRWQDFHSHCTTKSLYLTFFPEFSWDPYPEGLARVVENAWSYGLPIYVTENGTPHVVDRGVEVLEGHLSGIESSLASGVDVRGYFYWSYVDNYEWNHGFDLRFGLYELDPVTKERHARPVRDAFAEIVARGRVSVSD